MQNLGQMRWPEEGKVEHNYNPSFGEMKAMSNYPMLGL